MGARSSLGREQFAAFVYRQFVLNAGFNPVAVPIPSVVIINTKYKFLRDAVAAVQIRYVRNRSPGLFNVLLLT